MDRRSAKRANAYAAEAIRKLLLALRAVENSCTRKEYLIARRKIGFAIVNIDELLQETVYRHHPDLDEVRTLMEKQDAQKRKPTSRKPKNE